MTQNFNSKDINAMGIRTYGALLLPFDEKLVEEQAQTQTNPKEKTSLIGKLKSAMKNSYPLETSIKRTPRS